MFSDLLVVELASVLAGPAVGMFFAEMGARVVKVENPRTSGDVTRSWRTAYEVAGGSAAYFSSVNWGKESVAVDLALAGGREVVHRLTDRADVVIASYRPGAESRLGMDPVTLRDRNPRLIYARVTAYGEGDPRVGYDAVIQAESGYASMNGTADSGPLKMPVALMDLLAGHQLKTGVLAALLDRERTGQGSVVSVSLFDAALASLANQAANCLMTGRAPARLGSGHPNIVPYGTSFPCLGGGHVVLAVGTDRQFRALAEALEDPELADDSRFATNPDRVRNRAVLEERIAERTMRVRRDRLLERLHRAGVPAGAVRDVGEALGSPEGRRLTLRAAAGVAAVRTRAFAIDDAPPVDLTPPPSLSEHARTVLEDLLGYDHGAVEGLARSGAVLLPPQEGAV